MVFFFSFVSSVYHRLISARFTFLFTCEHNIRTTHIHTKKTYKIDACTIFVSYVKQNEWMNWPFCFSLLFTHKNCLSKSGKEWTKTKNWSNEMHEIEIFMLLKSEKLWPRFLLIYLLLNCFFSQSNLIWFDLVALHLDQNTIFLENSSEKFFFTLSLSSRRRKCLFARQQ